MSTKVSIIVPVYNSEKTLISCISNLVHQTLTDIELLFVNDCSTDNSLSILNSCSYQFPEIVHILSTSKNLGAGGARNLALDIAKGEYIGFVDSDDLVDTSMFEKLYQTAIINNYDMVDCGFYYQSKDTNILYTADRDTGILTDEKRNHLICTGGYLWSKLIRRDLIEKHHLRFREHVVLEDMDFLMYLFATSYNIGNLHEVLYIYKDSPTSASKEKTMEQYYNNIINAMTAVYEKMSALPNYFSIKLSVEYSIIQLYSYGINCCLKSSPLYNSTIILKYLSELRDLKMKYISIPYENNSYVQEKISKLNQELMKKNDESPNILIKNY